MRCEEARLALTASRRPEPVDGTLAEAHRHVAECLQCQQYSGLNRVILNRLGQLSAVRAPAELRKRVESAIAVEGEFRIRRTRVRWMTGAGTALLAAAAALLLVVTRPEVPTGVAQPLISQAQVGLAEPESVTSGDAREIGQWLAERIGYEIHIPEISTATLVGARVADLNGIQIPTVLYLYGWKPIAYFALPSSDVLGRRLKSDEVRTISSDGYQVAVWTEKGLARAVVAPLPQLDVVAIARECRSQAAS